MSAGIDRSGDGGFAAESADGRPITVHVSPTDTAGTTAENVGGSESEASPHVEGEEAVAVLDTPLDAQDARDRRLVRRARAGDARAFEQLVQLYQHRIFGLTLRMMGDRQEAEDLAQEVFLTVHRALPTYRGEGRFYTWLYRIATNTCKNRLKYLRGRNFHRSVPVEDSAEAQAREHATGPVMTLHSQVAGPEAMTEGTRLETAIQTELAMLDPEHRLLIVLRDIQGLSYHDILRITGLQEGTLKSRLHRARLALRDRLRPHIG